jgi:bifunctional DNA-binding transcriptional regulator/antitoxin component of YhaV-PrlF toxin-antitoxin module
MSEESIIVGKRGEIYTGEKLRKKVGIRKGGRVKATIVDGKLIIEPMDTLEEIIRRRPLVSVSPEKVEKISEEAQKEQGAFG